MTQPLLLLVLLVAAPARAQDGWVNVGEADGIVTDRREVPGSPLLEWRGSVRVEAPIERVWAVIHDVSGRTEWMDRCVESRLVSEGPGHQRFYNRTSAPWPASHRDVVLHAEVQVDRDEVRLPFRAVDDPALPALPGVVRMRVLEGVWTLRPQRGGAATWVGYQVHADPGGWIPSWVADRVARSLPLGTLRRLRARVDGWRDPGEEARFLSRPGVRDLLARVAP